MRWLSILLIFALLPFSQAFSATPLKIVIDPGHGGSDRGAVRNGIRESDIALKVSLLLRKKLAHNGDFKVYMTRTTNKLLTLQERAEFANDVDGDLFISIHANASRSLRAEGAEFYIQNQIGTKEEALFLAHRENEVDPDRKIEVEDRKARVLASIDEEITNPDILSILEDMQRSQRIIASERLARQLFSHWRGYRKKKKFPIRQAPFFVTSNVNMPSTLVELGYLSHKREAKAMTNSQIQEKMAQNLYQGLIKFKRALDQQQ